MRLFLAGPLPDALQAEVFSLLTAARRAAPQARWVRPGQLHLTLAFLGELEASLVPALLEALQPVALRHGAVQLWLRGAGGFGRPRQPDVLYAGLAGDVEALRALQADVQQALRPWAAAATEAADSPFRPHLTLARARARHGDAALGRCMRSLREQLFGHFLLDKLVLFQSQLGPAGARHTPLAEFALASAAVAQV